MTLSVRNIKFSQIIFHIFFIASIFHVHFQMFTAVSSQLDCFFRVCFFQMNDIRAYTERQRVNRVKTATGKKLIFVKKPTQRILQIYFSPSSLSYYCSNNIHKNTNYNFSAKLK